MVNTRSTLPHSPSPDHLDSDWRRLSATQRREIHSAFNDFTKNKSADRKSMDITPSDNPGGFIVESDDEPDEPDTTSLLPFSRIRPVLRSLNLDDNDEQVLDIFKQAALGWGSGDADDTDTATIPWQDFASVAAVLVAQRDADRDLQGDEMDDDDDDVDAYKLQPGDDDLSDPSDPGDPSDAESDRVSDLIEHDKPSKKSERKVSQKQHDSSLDTFRLFFPDPHFVTQDSTLSLSDLKRVIRSLKEKISDEQATKMMSMVSTSNNTSVSYQDFTQMLLYTNLI
ncbi:hypothetical protein E3P86_03591 [Wallemia ichthyophaga]|uniref:EF-hand domain-containing protein n=1 Tax=Wallemia ichthyophaga TaxID=245174 RepID=A0A4T0IJQ0_WALIC|nr:hypothetical protein E3P86_03591 [Wallemia ichthyophaga]